MKKLFVVLAFFATFANAAVVKRGAPLSKDAKVVTVAQVLETPEAFTKEPVIVEGVAKTVCQNKGCWMELDGGVRMTFKDYAFFVPTKSKGRRIRAEGVVEVKTLSKDEADHLEGEGAKVNRQQDGTAKEVSFVASGVELR
ncbi:MAG TPA: DUF4920 domain-containing protein [Thermoanaerobaculia bacterium]|nr:DUF4920 domain-containing protein [Thermoanaerobaculia bacterium]